MTREEMEKTELMGSIGAVMNTPSGKEFTCACGNSTVHWSTEWKSHVALDVSSLRAPRAHTKKMACIPRSFPQENWGKRGLEWKLVYAGGVGGEARSHYSKSLWIHEDAELAEASEKLVPVPPMVNSSGGYHRGNLRTWQYQIL